MEEYKSKAHDSKVRRWLSNCSSRIMYYGGRFEPRGASYRDFQDHRQDRRCTATNGAAVGSIPDSSDAGSRVACLRQIIEFLLISIRWYKRGKLASSLYAIGKPFSVVVKPIVEELTELSRRVMNLQALHQKRRSEIFMSAYDCSTRQWCGSLKGLLQQQMLHNQSLLAFQGEYKHMLLKGQIDEIRNKLLPDSEGAAPDETLAYCRSLRNRRRQRMPTQLPSMALATLKSWIADPTSSLLLANGNGVRTSSLDFAADFLDAVLECGYPVLWALPSIAPQGQHDSGGDDKGSTGAPKTDARPSSTGILRSLISQAHALDPHIVADGSHPITAKHFKTASGIEQWFQLLERCMAAFPRLFVVLDLGFVELAAEHPETEHEYFRVADFAERLREIVRRRDRGGLKVVVVSWQFAVATSMDATELFEEWQIFTDMGRRVERLMRQPKYRAVYRRKNEQFALRLRASVAQPED
ncbi:hypothetical protein RB601_005473 [Gaeumannomyces tritici]